MRKLSIFICFLVCIGQSQAQTLAIDWIEVSGNKVIVHYNLEDANASHQYLVNLHTSRDNYTAALTKVTGDVGQEVRPGLDKKIVWDITKELGDFKGSLAFEIRGRVFVPFVKLTEFTEGKTFKRGNNVPITWTSGNVSGQVNIELYKGQERISAENSVPNVGKYDWHIPANTKKGNDYQLKFTNSKDRNDFVVSKPFAIQPKIPTVAKIVGVAVVGTGIYFLIKALGGENPVTPTEESLPPNPGIPSN